MPERERLLAKAVEILRENDRGHYTVPTKDLYPYQWNWDSCLTALGQRHLDEARAWLEIETLLAHQWPDGMVPHIVFHAEDEGYFPGPEIWRTGRPTPTSGVTQPPILAYAMRQLSESAKDRSLVAEKLPALLPKAAAWHRWFYANRDPEGSGLVAILHPWESGRDNSIDWDEPLAAVPTEGVEPYDRRDIHHVSADQRPTKVEYDRYLWLLQLFRGLGWDNGKLHAASPFKVVDPGFNAILIRSDEDLAVLAESWGFEELAREARARLEPAKKALETLWHEGLGQYACYDRAAGRFIESASVGGLLPLLCGAERHAALAARIDGLLDRARFGLSSHDPSNRRFDGRRYWRGPSWLIVNSLLANGLERTGHRETAERIVQSSLSLIRDGGFAEYYDPHDGAPLGGANFTWTAAMALELVQPGG